MIRFLFFLFLVLHGLIHLMGFAKAFGYGHFSQLTKEISKPAGIVWLTTAFLLLAGAVLFLWQKDRWWMIALPAALLSQVLLFSVWGDAKYGTPVNFLILVVAVLSIGSWRFERSYRHDVAENTKRQTGTIELLTPSDIRHLPLPVQNYLRYTGAIGKPKVQNYKVVFRGQMRDKGKDWFSFTSEQYNVTDHPTRLFFMKGKLYGVKVPGYHFYKNGHASMQIKLFGWLPVVSESAGILDKAETVTILNDMCLLAPASLIHPGIRWEAISDSAAKAIFTVGQNTVSATLFFNRKGQLVNFVSDDRYAIADKKQYRFSTPVGGYKAFHGILLPGYGEAIWHYPDGDFVYGRFSLQDVQYNVQ